MSVYMWFIFRSLIYLCHTTPPFVSFTHNS